MAPPGFTCWGGLPNELKHQIFRLLEDDRNISFSELMNYILVCRSWQHWFEAGNFEHLVVDATKVQLRDLVQFVDMNPRRRSAVKKITLNICLQTWDRASSFTGRQYVERCLRMTILFLTFLECLKSWTRESHEAGLELEIHVKPEPSAAAWSAPIDVDLIKPSLKVPVVTTLTLCGQYRRCIPYHALTFLFKNTFPKLEHLYMEEDRGRKEDDLPSDLVQSFPATLRNWHFVVYGSSDYDGYLMSQDCEPGTPFDDLVESRDLNLNWLPLGKVSTWLENIVLPDTIDAYRFLRSSQRTTWPRLRSLSIEGIAIRHQDSKVRRAILVEAAKAVQNMPAMTWFQLWGDCTWSGIGACFQCTMDHGGSRTAHVLMAVSEPWNFRLSAQYMWQGEVKKAWESVAYAHDCELKIKFRNDL